MKTVELISGFTVLVPNREYELLMKMVNSKQKFFNRHKMSMRASALADNLVQHHLLDRDDEKYILRQFTIC